MVRFLDYVTVPMVFVAVGAILAAIGVFWAAYRANVEKTESALKRADFERQLLKKSEEIAKLQENTQRDIQTLTDVVSKANVSDLNAQFSGGFQTFGFLVARSATGEQDTIRSLTSYDVDLACDSAMISEITASNLTMQLQNPRITRAKTTPTGTQPAGAVFVNGNAIWKMDRRPKVVSINNAINSWGYVIGGYVLYDKDDVLIVAVGLQKVE